MDVFVAFDPADVDRVGSFTAALADVGSEVTFTYWIPQYETGPYIDPPGVWPLFYDHEGRPLVTDIHKIRRARGVLALISRHAAGSEVVVAALEEAYAAGTRVLGVQLDAGAAPPRNLARRAIVADDPAALAVTLRSWNEEHQQLVALSPMRRLRRLLDHDRHGRR